jgi:hypothetical protein
MPYKITTFSPFPVLCLHRISDTVSMASFRFTKTFDSLLDELCEKLNKTKTAVIVDAVSAYASGILPDRELLARFDTIAGETAYLKQGQSEIRTLCLQILKNQQSDVVP